MLFRSVSQSRYGRQRGFSAIDHPLAALLLKYANLNKFRSTYLLKMRDFPQPFHINYQHANVACLTENNLIKTMEKGLMSIRDVEVGLHVLSENGYYPVTAKESFEDEVVKVTLRNGAFLEGNRKHPVLTSDGQWTKLGDLVQGQRVTMCRPFIESKGDVILPEIKWNKTCRTKVLGISRKSIPIIDNLGISAQQVQEEFQKTGDFAKAVGNIIDESMGLS